jgi:hypothetical protein
MMPTREIVPRDSSLSGLVGMTSNAQPAPRQRSFFAIARDARTWRRLLFLLLAAPLGLVHAALILAGAVALTAIAGVALSLPILPALVLLALLVPAVGAGMVVIHVLLRMQVRVNHRLLGVPIPPSTLDDLHAGNAFRWCAQRVGDRWTWLGLVYLLVITLLGAVAVTLVALVVGVSASLVSEAIGGGSVDVAIGGGPLGIPGARVLMALLAPVLVIVALHLASFLAGLAAAIGRRLLGPEIGESPRGERSALSPAAQTAYAPSGSVVGEPGS